MSPSRSEHMKNAGRAADEKGNQDAGAKARCPLAGGDDWIEIELVGKENAPMRDVECVITDPTGNRHAGKTDARGIMKITDIPSGECAVTFPKLDRAAWGPEPEKGGN